MKCESVGRNIENQQKNQQFRKTNFKTQLVKVVYINITHLVIIEDMFDARDFPRQRGLHTNKNDTIYSNQSAQDYIQPWYIGSAFLLIVAN